MNRGTQIVAIENSGRDNYADFLKYVLIGLVVMGHFINMHQLTKGLGGLYTWICTFHMPLFVFISGHFSKHISNYRRKSIDTLLWPFVVIQILNIIYTAIIPLEPLKENIFYPYHQNWYLIALFWWRCFVPYRQFFKKWLVIVLSFAFSLSIGFFPEWNGFLGLYKTAYFLTFFVLGVYCDDLAALIEKHMQRKWFWLSAFAVITVAVFVLSLHAGILYKMNYAFKANFGYEGDWLNVALRAFAILVSLVMCASVLLVIKILYNKLNFSRIISGGVQCYASWGMSLS